MRVLSFMPEQSERKIHTSKINVSAVLCTIFFLSAGHKMHFIGPYALWSKRVDCVQISLQATILIQF